MSLLGAREWQLFLVLAALGALQPSVVAASTELAFMDDQGVPIEAPLEVCWVDRVETRCADSQESQGASIPERFDSVRIEGPRHGPLPLRARDMPPVEDGRITVTVPRKAKLIVGGAPAGLTLSIYAPDSPDFRRPRERATPRRSGESDAGAAWIAALPGLLSLSARGAAPDLRWVDPAPGEVVRLTYRSLTGWSLLSRITAASSGEPVAGATVDLKASAGYPSDGLPSDPLRSNAEGLVIFSGIGAPLLEADVTAPGFVKEYASGWTASPASFGFEEVRLGRGGTILVRVSLAGEFLEGAECLLLYAFRPSRREEVDTRLPVDLGVTDVEGRCAASGVPPGEYELAVTPPGQRSPGRALEPLNIRSETTHSLNLDLRPMTISGEVSQGDQPMEGYEVRVQSADVAPRHPPAVAAQARTDAEGRYEVMVWRDGRYMVALLDPHAIPAEIAHVEVRGADVARDFRLAEQGIVGIVTDQDDDPLAEATVSLKWPTEMGIGYRSLQTTEAGEFHFALNDESGLAEVTALRPGYRSDSEAFNVVHGEPLPAFHLKLEKLPGLRGRVVDDVGRPRPAVRVAAFRARPGESPTALDEARSGEQGEFFLGTATDASTTLFFSGPGCPLSFQSVLAVGEDELILPCFPLPASIRLTLLDEEGAPVPGIDVLVRSGSAVIPGRVLATHVQGLGLTRVTDGAGRLALIALAPGDYELYRADQTNPGAILAGYPGGFLTSVSLNPFETREVDVILRSP